MSHTAASSASNAGLVPGYKHVESFGPREDYLPADDDDDDDEEEEFYFTLDLGTVDQTLVPTSSSYRLIGLDTPTPFLQIAGTIMKGHFKTLIGTELIFKDVSGESPPEEETGTNTDFNVPKPKRSVRYFTKTDKRILFYEVTLKPKSESSETGMGSGSGLGSSGGGGQIKFIHSDVPERGATATGAEPASNIITFVLENPPTSASATSATATGQAAGNTESMRIDVDAVADVIDPSLRGIGDDLEATSEVRRELEEENMEVDEDT